MVKSASCDPAPRDEEIDEAGLDEKHQATLQLLGGASSNPDSESASGDGERLGEMSRRGEAMSPDQGIVHPSPRLGGASSSCELDRHAIVQHAISFEGRGHGQTLHR